MGGVLLILAPRKAIGQAHYSKLLGTMGAHRIRLSIDKNRGSSSRKHSITQQNQPAAGAKFSHQIKLQEWPIWILLH